MMSTIRVLEVARRRKTVVLVAFGVAMHTALLCGQATPQRMRVSHTLSNDGDPTLIVRVPDYYSVPDTSNHLAIVPAGTPVEVLDSRQDASLGVLTWKKVRVLSGQHKGVTGWVSSRTVQLGGGKPDNSPEAKPDKGFGNLDDPPDSPSGTPRPAQGPRLPRNPVSGTPPAPGDQVPTAGPPLGTGTTTAAPRAPLDTTRNEGWRAPLEKPENGLPNLAGTSYEVTRPPLSQSQIDAYSAQGLKPPNCLSYVIGETRGAVNLLPGDQFGPNPTVYMGLADTYSTLDGIFSHHGYGPREALPAGGPSDLPAGTVLVYEAPLGNSVAAEFSEVFGPRIGTLVGNVYSGPKVPAHVAILNNNGYWESVTGKGGALITHADPGALAGPTNGQPAYIYRPK